MQMVRAVGSMQAAGHENLMISAASYPPSQKSEDGAPSVSKRETENKIERAVHPPNPALTA